MNDMNESRPGVASKRRLLEVPIDSIKPNPAQPRQYFEEAELEELAASIAAVGVIQPVVVRPSESEYELVVGERRLRAASMAGLDSIPAVIAETETRDMRVTALIENIHRSDLSAIEEAEALQSILEDTKWSQTELAARLGLSQSAVSNKLRLLKLEAPVQTLVMQGKLGERQARALIGLSREEQVSMALVAVEEELPANELERRVKEGRIISAKERRTVEPSVPKTSRGSPAVAGGPTGEILKDIAELVERNRRKGIQVAWSVKELAQRELILELIVDLKSASEEPRE